MRGLPAAYHGKQFVQLSDLHSGFAKLEAAYEMAIERVNALKAEFLMITGDFVDDHAVPIDYPIHKFLSRFCTKHGTFGVFGNHEQRRGVVQARREYEKGDVRILMNEAIDLDGVWLAGIDDLFEGKPDIPKALAYIPKDCTGLVMAHNPATLDRISDRDVVLFSGHTHGGQFNLRFPLPSPKLLVKMHLHCNQVAGWYTNGMTRGYTNRGLGVTGKPYRINCPAEIAVFRMVPLE